jgi:hypothetical protein
MMKMMLRQLTFGLILCAALSACGGGSSSSGIPQAPASAPATSASVVISIKIPAASTATGTAAVRQPLYVSANTQSATISVNGATPVVINLAATSPNCTAVAGGGRSCTATVTAPVGTDTFAETLYSAINAGGSALSQGKTSHAIVAGQANTVALTLDGIVAALTLAVANAAPPVGTPASIGLTVNINDASGAAIIGSDPFVTPVTLTDSDTSGGTALSKTTLNSPADAAALTVAYNGKTTAQAVIGASAGAVKAASATITPKAGTTVAFNDYATFGYDNQRTVYNPNTTAITPAAVPSIHLAWQAALGGYGDYNTQTQPVLATEIAGHQGVIFVGGGSGNVYGYDATSGALLWTTPTEQETYTCENTATIYFGVGGTPAYDPSTKSIYVVGNMNASPNALATNSLYHLDGASGAVLGKVSFAPPIPGWNSLDFSHTSVTLGSNGLAYVGTGATCDISSWIGRVAAISVPSMTVAKTFYPVWNGTTQPWGGGGIWGWGGVSLDSSGDVLTGVGNTDNGTTTHGGIAAPFVAATDEYSGLGEALVKLAPDISAVVDSQHPIPQNAYVGSSVDLDLQGTPAIITPNGAGCDPIAAIQGKSGTLFLFDELHIGNGPIAQYALAPSSYQDSFLGGPGYSAATGLIYEAVPSSSGSLFPPGMIAINPGCGTPAVAWHSAFGPDTGAQGTPRSVPAVSAGGVVFVGTDCYPDGNGGCTATPASVARKANGAVRKPAICCAPPGNEGGALWVLDASTGEVLNGGLPLITTGGPIRMPATVDGNWIFVLDNSGNMYGLTIDGSYPSVAEKARTINPRTLRVWEQRPQARVQ